MLKNDPPPSSVVLARLIVAFLLFLPSQARSAASLSLQSSASAVQVGDSFSVQLNVSGASNLYGWQVDVFFNPSVIHVLSTSQGTFLSSGGFTTFFLNGTLNNTLGLVDDLLATRLGSVLGASGNGLLATLNFQAVGPGVSPISLGNVVLASPSGASLPVGGLSGASVNVENPPNQSQIPTLDATGGCFLMLALLVAGSRWVRRRSPAREGPEPHSGCNRPSAHGAGNGPRSGSPK